jgi:hypothetical protein
MSDTYCDIHNRDKEILAGCSAHRANWYCPECEAFDDWESSLEGFLDKHTTEASYSLVYKAFNAALAIGERKGMERAAVICDGLIYDEDRPYAEDAAEDIRKEIK